MSPQLRKIPSGIKGLDEVTGGGLPAGRPALLCGGPGCGKTILAASFIAQGARHDGELGVYITFDERESDLEANTASLGFGLAELQSQDLVAIDYVHIDRQEIHETGEYDLEGLFIRLGFAIDKGAGAPGRDRRHRHAVCGHSQRSDPALRAAALVPLAERTRSHLQSSPRGAAREASRGMGSRNTSRTA